VLVVEASLTLRKLPICVTSELLYLSSDLLFARFSVYHDADLFDFINAPVGKGLPISQSLRPLIAVPTTAGTGSETTGTAILDITSKSFKTGIANRAMKPVLGIVVRLGAFL
jgi:alcohol dehydrogenase YqhD (iron-dependent ADH family)